MADSDRAGREPLPEDQRSPSQGIAEWRTSFSKSRPLATLLLLAVAAFVGANSLNYITPLRPGTDAGAYASIAMQALEGKVLYRDTMEAKPPVIVVLNGSALAFGDGTFYSIRVLERFFAIGCVLLAFFVVLTAFGKPSLALLAAAAYSFYAYGGPLLEGGNVTEEYALFFVLAGILCALRASPERERPSLLAVASGLSFGLAALTKEPFVFSSVPWFLLLVMAPRDGWRAATRRGGLFVLGALVPFFAFLGYLTLNGALSAWLERVFASAAYIGSLNPERTFLKGLGMGLQKFGSLFFATNTARVAFVVGIAAATVSRAFAARYRYVPYFFLLAFVCEWMGATLSSALFGHYFLQIVPSFILCCAMGGAFLIDECDRAFGNIWRSRILLLIFPVLLDALVIAAFWQRLRQPFVRPQIGGLSEFVRDHANSTDRLWVSQMSNSRFYIETGLLSPTKFSHFFYGYLTDTRATTSQQKVAQLKADLTNDPPAWIIIGADAAPLRSIGFFDWLCSEFTLAPVTDQGYDSPAHLYVRKDRASEVLAAGGPARDPQCALSHIDSSAGR